MNAWATFNSPAFSAFMNFPDSGWLVRRVLVVIDVLMWPTECIPGVCCAKEEWCPSLYIIVGHLFFSRRAVQYSVLAMSEYNRRGTFQPREGKILSLIMQHFYVIFWLPAVMAIPIEFLFPFAYSFFLRYYKLPHHLFRQRRIERTWILNVSR